jgi:hypothetical protein
VFEADSVAIAVLFDRHPCRFRDEIGLAVDAPGIGLVSLASCAHAVGIVLHYAR